jgi:phosphate transport system substrate-binding protein
MITPWRSPRSSVAALGVALVVAGCGEQRASLSGSIRIDGSRTLAPLTTAVARRFMAENPRVRVTVAASGTDAGGVAVRPVAVANDAVILTVDPGNPVRCLTTAQVFQIWRGNSEVTERWSQVAGLERGNGRNFIAWGPGTETETFAYFTKAVTGKQGDHRDYNNELENEGQVIAGIAGEAGASGYVDYPAFRQHSGMVKALAIDSGGGCVAPTPRTIADGTFRPLARRLFVYVSATALARPAMDAFLRFYLDNVKTMAPKVGLVPLTPAQVRASKAAVARSAADAARSTTSASGG